MIEIFTSVLSVTMDTEKFVGTAGGGSVREERKHALNRVQIQNMAGDNYSIIK